MKIKTLFFQTICAAIIGVFALSAPVYAQQKTVKACEDEWKADKAANQKKGITEKAYVEKCRAGAAAAKPAAPAAASSSSKEKAAAAPAAAQKTVKACEDEWKADKAANQKKGITEKAYVEKCRAGAATAAPAAAPAAPAQAKTPAPVAPSAIAPAKPAAPAAAAPPAAGVPAGANQYVTEAQAKAHCPSDTVVWANLDSKIYHFAGHSDYGHTKSGAYMCEKDTTAQGIRAAKNEKRP